MKRQLSFCVFFVCLAFISFSKTTKSSTNTTKTNVLFIAVGDLRLQAGVYGQSQMITPNIYKQGNEGDVFSKAYCNVPACGASHASLLSGLRPTTRFFNYHASKDKEAPEIASLPKHFKKNGYTTISLGKIYHHTNNDLGAWSEKPWDGVYNE